MAHTRYTKSYCTHLHGPQSCTTSPGAMGAGRSAAGPPAGFFAQGLPEALDWRPRGQWISEKPLTTSVSRGKMAVKWWFIKWWLNGGSMMVYCVALPQWPFGVLGNIIDTQVAQMGGWPQLTREVEVFPKVRGDWEMSGMVRVWAGWKHPNFRITATYSKVSTEMLVFFYGFTVSNISHVTDFHGITISPIDRARTLMKVVFQPSHEARMGERHM